MTYLILISLCIIILIAYLFEITSKYSKVPGVILLLCLGIMLRQLTSYLDIHIPDLSVMLPLMGTLGLILIVLEGSMDLSINKEKRGLIQKSFASAVLLFILFVLIFSITLYYSYSVSFRIALLNAIPFGIISSAVAIPSTLNLKESEREFIIYESSVSDIVGILVFDFILFNTMSIGTGVLVFTGEIIGSVVFSIIITAILAYTLHKINHHVKYVIILTAVVLTYSFAKITYWPALIVVLIFGLILNNIHFFKNRFTIKHIDFKEFDIELISFKQITGELTFLVRSFFFLIFGFYTSIYDLVNYETLIISLMICTVIFLLRAFFYKYILKMSIVPFLFFTPRGLITILLFLSIPAELRINLINEGLVAQVIFISILFMALGNVFFVKHSQTDAQPNGNDVK